MILSGLLLLPDDSRRSLRHAPGTVVVKNGFIESVREGEVIDHADLGGSANRYLICPALTDLHLHLPQFDSIGVHGLGLLDWLQNVIFPAEKRWSDAAYAQAMTHRTIDQLFAVGTTGICAYTTVHHEAAMRAIEAVRSRHMRGRIGQTLMDRGAPDYLIRPKSQLLDECRAMLMSGMNDPRVTPAVTPRFAISCSKELLHGCGELAAEFDAIVQTHLSETVDECAMVQKLFGDDYVSVYQKAGLLGEKSIHGHGIHLDALDRRRLTQTGTIVAHCPTANSFLMSGTMDRQALLDSGVRMGLGSDIGGGYERSMIRVARAMIETAAALRRSTIPASEAWWQITAGNAALAGWPSAGRLSPGCAADLIVIEADIPWQNAVDPLGMLTFAWDDRWIRNTIASGEIVYRAR